MTSTPKGLSPIQVDVDDFSGPGHFSLRASSTPLPQAHSILESQGLRQEQAAYVEGTRRGAVPLATLVLGKRTIVLAAHIVLDRAFVVRFAVVEDLALGVAQPGGVSRSTGSPEPRRPAHLWEPHTRVAASAPTASPQDGVAAERRRPAWTCGTRRPIRTLPCTSDHLAKQFFGRPLDALPGPTKQVAACPIPVQQQRTVGPRTRGTQHIHLPVKGALSTNIGLKAQLAQHAP